MIIGFFLISVIKFELPLVAVSKELRNINQKIDEAKKTGLELEKLSDYLKSDAYLERQARLKLNYKKPDEKVVFVYQSANTQNSTPKLENISNSKFVTNLKGWWRYLVNK